MIDVTMAVRSRPFREWTVVYFDPAKTNEEKLLKRLRSNGCRKAARDGLLTSERTGCKLTLQSRITVAGDVLLLSVAVPEKVSLEVRPPEGWSVPDGARQALPPEGGRVAIQVPSSAKQGLHTIQVDLDVAGETRSFKLEAEVVRRVK